MSSWETISYMLIYTTETSEEIAAYSRGVHFIFALNNLLKCD